MNKTVTILLSLSITLLIVGGAIAFFSLKEDNLTYSTPENDEAQKTSFIVKSLNEAKKESMRVSSILERILLKKKKKELNNDNCKGVLADFDKNGQYDGTVLGIHIPSQNKDAVIHYNFCAFLWSSNPTISIISTLRPLLSKELIDIIDGKEFVAVIIAKKRMGDKNYNVEMARVPKESLFR